jgi:hypothetical protein
VIPGVLLVGSPRWCRGYRPVLRVDGKIVWRGELLRGEGSRARALAEAEQELRRDCRLRVRGLARI